MDDDRRRSGVTGCCAPGRDDADGTTPRTPAPAGAPGAPGAPRTPATVARLLATGGLPPGCPPDDLLDLPAGTFAMGAEDAHVVEGDGEGPVRAVTTSAYRIAATTVTNAQFGEFVEQTGYLTEAQAYGWSFVFAGLLDARAQRHVVAGTVPGAPWWRAVRGATWQAPTGPGSGVDDRPDHPVVHVTWEDAAAYCLWRGVRLPTEAEWERAARGGLEQEPYPWGHELEPGGEHRMNVWQGPFPDRDTGADGWVGTAPVRAYAPNGLGLYAATGNVWEWTADWFSPRWHRADRPQTRHDPQGPSLGTGRVVRGGSYLCHASYCRRYRVSARTQTTPDTSLGHTGFRVAADGPAPPPLAGRAG